MMVTLTSVSGRDAWLKTVTDSSDTDTSNGTSAAAADSASPAAQPVTVVVARSSTQGPDR
jgi:hypothetical protein